MGLDGPPGARPAALGKELERERDDRAVATLAVGRDGAGVFERARGDVEHSTADLIGRHVERRPVGHPCSAAPPRRHRAGLGRTGTQWSCRRR